MEYKRSKAPKCCFNFLQGKGRLKAETQRLYSRNCCCKSWLAENWQCALPCLTVLMAQHLEMVWALFSATFYSCPQVSVLPAIQRTTPSLVSSCALRRRRGYDQSLTRWMTSPQPSRSRNWVSGNRIQLPGIGTSQKAILRSSSCESGFTRDFDDKWDASVFALIILSIICYSLPVYTALTSSMSASGSPLWPWVS